MSDITAEQVRGLVVLMTNLLVPLASQLEADQQRIRELEQSVANWERKELQRGSCCSDMEERCKALEQREAGLRERIEALDGICIGGGKWVSADAVLSLLPAPEGAQQ